MNPLRLIDRLAGWWFDKRTAGFCKQPMPSIWFERVVVDRSGLEIVAETAAVADMASRVAALLDHYAAENFVTFTMMPRPDHGQRPVEVTVKWLTGKATATILTEQKARIKALEQQLAALEREVCTCPWPADAARTRHLLACRLMQMEHAAIAREEKPALTADSASHPVEAT